MHIRNELIGQAIISGNEDDYNRIQEKESARKQPPTEEQIVLLRQFLREFRIKTPLPHFATVCEMDQWKTKQVKIKMGV